MKKKSIEGRELRRFSLWLKLLLIMKMIVILLLVVGLTASYAKSDAQTTKLNLKLKSGTVKDVIEEIERQTDLSFMYDNSVFNVDRQFTINVENETVKSVVEKLISGENLKYEMVNRYIVITEKSSLPTTQQQKSISGKVTDSSGALLPGVSVVIKGTTTGVITDMDGKYTLGKVPDNATLQFSFVGMKKQELIVGNKTTINVTLEEDAIGIEEVVAIGYGIIKKTELTSAVSNVTANNFVKGAVRDAAQLIQGKVAGLNVIQTNANPVSGSQISLRGITTLKSGTSPLVIIDGVPGSSLTQVAPEDIESIDVLKDGSAAAIYGTRGTNGVILITTKSVKGEIKNAIEFDSYVSTQVISKKLDFMDANQYRELVTQQKPGAVDYGGNTNWLDQVLQKPVSYVNNLSLKGGNNSSNYIVNLNYKSLEGIMAKSDNNILTTRLEANHSMFGGKIRINANIIGLERNYFSGVQGGSFSDDVYRNALIFNPTDPVKDANGKWSEHISMNQYNNPVALVQETLGENKETNLRTYGNLIYTPINDLIIKLMLSRNKFNSVMGYSETKNHISNLLNNRNGYAYRGTSSNVDDLSELTTQYSKAIKDHSFNILGGYSWQKSTNENYTMTNWDFPSDVYSYNNMAAGQALTRGEAKMNSSKSEAMLIGYFFRLNYNYKRKYLLMASIRHEGSSKFGANNKWGNFPAISAGWNIKDESFLNDLSWLSGLKLRTGYGITGTEPDSPYMSLSRLKFSPNTLINGSWIPTIMPSTNSNPNLRWEKKEEINIGLDYSLFRNRISGSLDLYKRTTRDMLWDYNVPKPPYLYNTIVANAGTMENKGLEFHLELVPIKAKDFIWTSTINYSTNKNKVVSLSNDNFKLQSGYFYTGNTGEPIQQATHIVKEGQPIGNFYGYKAIDIDENGYWIIEGNDGKPKSILNESTSDKKVIGNGIPKHILGWDNSIVYKNFDLNVTMRGAFGYQIFNFPRLFYEQPVMLTRGNILSTAYNNVYGKRPLNDKQSLDYVSYFIENGDFWKIDNVTFGYNSNFKSNVIKGLRLYFSCSNLATITGYSGIDPEVNVLGLSPGIDDRNRYPSSRTFTLGLKLTF